MRWDVKRVWLAAPTTCKIYPGAALLIGKTAWNCRVGNDPEPMSTTCGYLKTSSARFVCRLLFVARHWLKRSQAGSNSGKPVCRKKRQMHHALQHGGAAGAELWPLRESSGRCWRELSPAPGSNWFEIGWRALRRAARPSGSSTTAAMITPTTAMGAPAEATAASMAGASDLASRPISPLQAPRLAKTVFEALNKSTDQ